MRKFTDTELELAPRVAEVMGRDSLIVDALKRGEAYGRAFPYPIIPLEHDCLEWLRERYVNVVEDSSSSQKSTDAQRPVAFFEEVVRNFPWARIRVFPAPNNKPLAMQFKLRCSFRPSRFQWAFGDGEESGLPEPTHVYPAPGTYRVAVSLHHPDGSLHQRAVNLRVPEATISTAATAAHSEPQPSP